MIPDPYAFTFEPLFVALGAAAAVFYGRAARGAGVPWWRVTAFGFGLALVVLAVNSPLETIAAHYLLLVHLLQNVMISDWAPPLLVIGLTPAMRAAVARRGGRIFAFVTRPQIALPIWLVGWYVIHLAAVYDAALRNQWLLNLEHLALVAIGVVFWWPVISDAPHALSAPIRITYLGAGFVLSVFLGLGLTFAGSAFYDFYEGAPRLWGLDPVQDQNLGGVLMTGEQAIVFLTAITWQLLRLLREEEEKEAQQRERDARLIAELEERERRA